MHTIDQLLALEGYEQLSPQQRWLIIGEIEQQIDQLQRCQIQLRQSGLGYAHLHDEIDKLRKKRMWIWISFNPNVAGMIRMAA